MCFPELVAYGRDQRPETVKYQMLSSLLLNEFQKQRGDLSRLKDANAALTRRMAELDRVNLHPEAPLSRLDSLERRLLAIERTVVTRKAER